MAGDQLVVLEDDKELQNADNIIPAVNAAAAEANPALLEALNTVSAVLTTEDLIEMNAAVDVERQSAVDVAAAYVDRARAWAPASAGAAARSSSARPTSPSRRSWPTSTPDVLTAAGFQATVQTVGNRELYLPALQRGEIQAFPEYLATVTDIINGRDGRGRRAGRHRRRRRDTVEALTPLAEEAGLVFGEPAEAADQNAFAVTTEFADALGVTTLSELADACGDGSLTLGGPGECPDAAAVPAGPGGDLRPGVRRRSRSSTPVAR